MTNEQILIDSALRAWKTNQTRVDNFFQSQTEKQLLEEVATGKNRLIYLWGHLAAINDAMFPLLGLGPKLYPELGTMFLSNPDHGVAKISTGSELMQASGQINHALWTAFTEWTVSEWLDRHTQVSEEDFAAEPHRNRFSIMLSRNMHMGFHLGQAILTRRKA